MLCARLSLSRVPTNTCWLPTASAPTAAGASASTSAGAAAAAAAPQWAAVAMAGPSATLFKLANTAEDSLAAASPPPATARCCCMAAFGCCRQLLLEGRHALVIAEVIGIVSMSLGLWEVRMRLVGEHRGLGKQEPGLLTLAVLSHPAGFRRPMLQDYPAAPPSAAAAQLTCGAHSAVSSAVGATGCTCPSASCVTQSANGLAAAKRGRKHERSL